MHPGHFKLQAPIETQKIERACVFVLLLMPQGLLFASKQPERARRRGSIPREKYIALAIYCNIIIAIRIAKGRNIAMLLQ